MKLIAITHCKYGQTKDKDGGVKVLEAQPGEAFEADADTAQTLIDAGGAATPEDYERAKAAAKSPDERLAELEADNARLREENEKLAAAGKPAGREKS